MAARVTSFVMKAHFTPTDSLRPVPFSLGVPSRQLYFLGVCLLVLTLCVAIGPDRAVAQAGISSANRDKVFREDTAKVQRDKEKLRKKALKNEEDNGGDMDVQAASVEYLKEEKKVRGTGGMIVSRSDLRVQADSGDVQTETKQGDFKGNIVIAGMEGELAADNGTFNLDSETGNFGDAALTLEEGAYHMRSTSLDKLGEFEYRLADAKITTCPCDEDDPPWAIYTSDTHITQEGYAHTYNSVMKMYGVPIFYSPYLAFPVKTQRASGLLVPSYGVSSSDGFQFTQPIFGVIDDSTDVMVTPFIETNSRVGTKFDFRKIFSRESKLDTRWIYSNESARGSSSRGLVVNNLADPTIDTNRYGGYFAQQWRSDQDADVPLSMVTDVHMVSDDLMPREIEDDKILEAESRYATSRMFGSASFGDYVYSEGGVEYNQAMVDRDETTLQRLPSLNVTAQKSFRPFGFNPYGVKMILKNVAREVQFQREEGYDGGRQDIAPSVAVPFHFQNFVSGGMQVENHQTYYQMDDETDPKSYSNSDEPRLHPELEFGDHRSVWVFSSQLQSGVERVYDLPEENVLSWMTSMGSESQQSKLLRVKHTIEPMIKYSYIPDTSQGDLPLYDSLDRVRARSLVTYGFTTALYGKFQPRSGVDENEIPELTPHIQDLPLFSNAGNPLSLDSDTDFAGPEIRSRTGDVRQLVEFSMRQSYDYLEDVRDQEIDSTDNDIQRRAFSDVYSELNVSPTQMFGLVFNQNYSVEDRDPNSWGAGTVFRDDRGDYLLTRYSFVGAKVGEEGNNLSQIEANAELVLTDRVRFGYYGRFDDRRSEFLVNKFALRLVDRCNCWYLDLGLSNRANPDKTTALVSITFAGLGDLAQKVGVHTSQAQ